MWMFPLSVSSALRMLPRRAAAVRGALSTFLIPTLIPVFFPSQDSTKEHSRVPSHHSKEGRGLPGVSCPMNLQGILWDSSQGKRTSNGSSGVEVKGGRGLPPPPPFTVEEVADC